MYWAIGQRIVKKEQQGKGRAEYGKYLIKSLAKEIEPEYGSGFGERQLNFCRQFYNTYSIVNAAFTIELVTIQNVYILSPRNHHLAKSVSDASWSKFVTMLEYKAKWYGKPLVKIDRFYPSSKTCYHCGHVKEDLALSDRYYTCPNCGELIDRDLNAAKNILDEGLRNRSAGTVDYTDGEGVRLACKHSLMKSESHKSLACG